MRENSAFKFIAVGIAMLMGSLSGAAGSFYLWAADPNKSDIPAPQAVNVGYLENVIFESPMPGKERIIISVSQLSDAKVESLAGNSLLVKLDNTFVPQDFRRPLGEGALRNVLRVLPAQKTMEGKQWAYVTIDLRERVPHSVRQEGRNILIDFNVSGLAERPLAGTAKPPALPERTSVPSEQKYVAERALGAAENYTGHKITLDLQDANIKSVFRLLAELANVNIVSGDDVKGTLTVSMKNVPWDQALDTILSITGLGKVRSGDVITVMTLEKIKKDEADRQAVLAAKRKAEAEKMRPVAESPDTRVVNVNYADAKELAENLKNLLKDDAGKPIGEVNVDKHSSALIIKAAPKVMTNMYRIIEKIDKPTPQILIKANIIETTKDMARDLGIRWGGMYGHSVGDQALFITPGGTGGSAVAPGSAFPGAFTPTSVSRGISGQGFGVNFPAATMTGTASGSLGLMFGNIGANILEVQLNALQKDGKLNILSSPSITTLDNQEAVTENGEKIPYVTTETSGGQVTRTVKFIDAVLQLKITPHVVDGKSMKMKILVQKDEVDTTRSVEGNPFIIKKQTETNLIVQDGDTIVISGLTRQRKLENVSGVPWLKEIPFLGWLFKGEAKNESMEEVLIFITPTILKPQTIAGIQEGPY